MSDSGMLRQALEQRRGRQQQLRGTVNSLKRQIRELKGSLRRHERAREIIREVGLATQQQLQYHISEITTLALEAVFPDPYALVVEFVQRRNKTECDLYFERGGERIDPITASGGGAVDVASFALRVASWSMAIPQSRSVLILDEPFRYLSTGLLPKAGEMLKQISDELKLQIIMVTHSEELVEAADKVFTVKQQKGVSIVEGGSNKLRRERGQC